MRIIAGSLKGRQFEAPKGQRTHPMSDKMRGAIFSALGNVGGLAVLDAFAGSGALSFEAVSRGAELATAIDSDPKAANIIKLNAKTLRLSNRVKVIRANAVGWSDNNLDERFDLVFCDPPYDRLQLAPLQKLSTHTKSGGLFVLSWPGNLDLPNFKGLEHLKTKHYGDSQFAVFRKYRSEL